jgi:hypothetical protein
MLRDDTGPRRTHGQRSRQSRDYAAGSLMMVLSLGRGAGVSRRIALSAATAAWSWIRSGSLCSTREPCASSAPTGRAIFGAHHGEGLLVIPGGGVV